MKDDDKWVEFPISKIGLRANGEVYPEDVVQAALDALTSRQPNRPLRGECSAPMRKDGESSQEYIRRLCSVHEDRVSHLIDVTTFKIKHDLVFAKVKPHGPMAGLARVLIANDNIHFGMRALVRYKEGNTTQTENLTVEHCDIISFDLVNPYN